MKKQYSNFLMLLIAIAFGFSTDAQVTNLGAGFEANSVSNNGEAVV